MNQRVAVIGAGRWGKNIVRVFHELGVLHAVCDPSASAIRQALHLAPGVKTVKDPSLIFSDPTITAVAIAVPSHLHATLALEALRCEKDVLVEKPMALSSDDGKSMEQCAEAHGRILMVGHVLRYHPAVETLAGFIVDGTLGRIRYIQSHRLNHAENRSETNVLWNFAPHDVSLLLALLGEYPSRISCHGFGGGKPVADRTLSTFEFPSGIRAHIFVSWLHAFKEQRMVITGDRATAIFDDTSDEKLILLSPRSSVPRRVVLPTDEPLLRECAHFLHCIRKRQRPRTDGMEGVAVLKVLEACEQALSLNVSSPYSIPTLVHA